MIGLNSNGSCLVFFVIFATCGNWVCASFNNLALDLQLPIFSLIINFYGLSFTQLPTHGLSPLRSIIIIPFKHIKWGTGLNYPHGHLKTPYNENV